MPTNGKSPAGSDSLNFDVAPEISKLATARAQLAAVHERQAAQEAESRTLGERKKRAEQDLAKAQADLVALTKAQAIRNAAVEADLAEMRAAGDSIRPRYDLFVNAKPADIEQWYRDFESLVLSFYQKYLTKHNLTEHKPSILYLLNAAVACQNPYAVIRLLHVFPKYRLECFELIENAELSTDFIDKFSTLLTEALFRDREETLLGDRPEIRLTWIAHLDLQRCNTEQLVALQRILVKTIDTLAPKATNDKQAAYQIVRDFLTNDSHVPSVFSKIDKVRASTEMLALIEKPFLIKQKNTNLCGPVSILSVLFARDPEQAVKTCIEFLTMEHRQTALALKKSTQSMSQDISLVDALLGAMKRAPGVNRLGYERTWFPMFEAIQGVTGPNRMAIWLKQIGQDVLNENFDLRQFSVFRSVLGTTYSSHHTDEPSTQALAALLRSAADPSVGHILLLDDSFVDEHFIQMPRATADFPRELEEISQLPVYCMLLDTQVQKPNRYLSGIPHYVYLESIEQDPQNQNIKATVYTWGKRLEIHCSATEFEQNFQGELGFQKQNDVRNTLSN